jgi:tape measure domain-containing protein
MATENVRYRISLEDRFSSGIDDADDSVRQLDSDIESTSESTASFAKTLGLVALAGVALKKTFDLASKSFTLGAEMEQTEIAFGTFLRSAEKGKAVIADLNQFANVTPFDNEEIIQSGRVLLAANVPAEKLTDTLETIGNIAAGTNVPITELGNIYAKVMNKGKLQAEELNQLAERGIPIIDTLAKEFGVTKAEVFKLGSEGKITSDVMNSAFATMTKKGGIFFKLMEKQSESASGLLSTLQGKMKLAGTELGKRMLPSAKSATKGMIDLADSLIRITRVKLSDELRETRFELNAEFEVLKKGNVTAEQRATLIADINSKYSDYLPNLITEKSSIEDIAAAQEIANKRLLERIALTAKREIIEEQVAKLQKANRKSFEEQIKAEKTLAEAKDLAREGSKLDAKLVAKIQKDGELAVEQREKAIKAEEKELARLKDILDITDELSALQGGFEGLETKTIAEPSKDLKAGIQTIKSAAPKTFNINIDSLVENFTVQSENVTEGAGQVKDYFTEALIRVLADAQAVGS